MEKELVSNPSLLGGHRAHTTAGTSAVANPALLGRYSRHIAAASLLLSSGVAGAVDPGSVMDPVLGLRGTGGINMGVAVGASHAVLNPKTANGLNVDRKSRTKASGYVIATTADPWLGFYGGITEIGRFNQPGDRHADITAFPIGVLVRAIQFGDLGIYADAGLNFLEISNTTCDRNTGSAGACDTQDANVFYGLALRYQSAPYALMLRATANPMEVPANSGDPDDDFKGGVITVGLFAEVFF